MSDVIISVENLGKKYRISHQGERQRYVALRDVIAQKAKRLFSRGQKSDLRPPSSDLCFDVLLSTFQISNLFLTWI